MTVVEQSFIVTGQQVMQNPSVGTNSSDGTATFAANPGSTFQNNWTIEFFYENPQPTEFELNGSSYITKAVLRNPAGEEMYTYRPMNPGQVANIQGDLSGVGDNYVVINWSVMVADAPNAPNPGRIAITNNEDGWPANSPVTFEVGNGAYDIIPQAAPCFTGDIALRTAMGNWMGDWVLVKDLKAGDKIMILNDKTGDRQFMPVIWVGKRTVRLPENIHRDWPVNINGELYSQQHHMLIRDRAEEYLWCKAKFMAEIGRGEIVRPANEMTYYHIVMKGGHQVIVTKSNLAESLLVNGYSESLFSPDAVNELHAAMKTHGLSGRRAGKLRYPEMKRRMLKGMLELETV